MNGVSHADGYRAQRKERHNAIPRGSHFYSSFLGVRNSLRKLESPHEKPEKSESETPEPDMPVAEYPFDIVFDKS